MEPGFMLQEEETVEYTSDRVQFELSDQAGQKNEYGVGTLNVTTLRIHF